MAGNPFRRSIAERLNEVPLEAPSSFDPSQTAQQRFPPIDGPGQSFMAQPAEVPSADFPNTTAYDASRSGQSDQRSIWEPLQPSLASHTNTTRAPVNPFARTLATSEAAYGGASSEVNREKQAQGPEDKTTPSRLDVDAFTNILLTGSAPSIKSGPPKTSFAGVNTAASSSNHIGSDSAMLHTQQSSFFDQGFHEFHPESPRSSSESVRTDSSDDRINDGNMLMGPVASRPEAPAPQAPPKPQRPRGPQTVSFADFDQAIPPDFQSTKSPQRSASPALHGILRPPSLTRKGSDMNKPLPRPPAEPTPAVMHSTSAATAAEDITPNIITDSTASTVAQYTPDPSGENVEASAAKKAPPPPPASRRQAGTAVPSRPPLPTSSSSSSLIRQPLAEPSQETTVNRQQQQQPFSPPPPPTRKPSRTPSIASIQSIGAGEQQAKPTPPPPPRRQPLRSHASRTSSDDSFKQEAAPPPVTLPTSSAPPPPPPRRAAGNSAQTTTIASRRTSNESSRPVSVYSIDGQQDRPSKEPLTQVLETTPANDEDLDDAARRAAAVEQVFEQAAAVAAESSAQGGANLLADMTAFQREIDALMAKSGG